MKISHLFKRNLASIATLFKFSNFGYMVELISVDLLVSFSFKMRFQLLGRFFLGGEKSKSSNSQIIYIETENSTPKSQLKNFSCSYIVFIHIDILASKTEFQSIQRLDCLTNFDLGSGKKKKKSTSEINRQKW